MVERFTHTGGGRYNIARDQRAIVRLADGAERALRWGLLAPWRGHGGKRGPNVYEATPEAIATTPFLRKAKRAVVLADGWYVWRKIGSRRRPSWIHASGTSAFEVVVATHADDGVESFALVLAPAAPLVAPFAPMMPAIVGGDATLAGWRVDPVGNHVDNVAHDDPQCIAPLGNPAQGSLF